MGNIISDEGLVLRIVGEAVPEKTIVHTRLAKVNNKETKVKLCNYGTTRTTICKGEMNNGYGLVKEVG